MRLSIKMIVCAAAVLSSAPILSASGGSGAIPLLEGATCPVAGAAFEPTIGAAPDGTLFMSGFQHKRVQVSHTFVTVPQSRVYRSDGTCGGWREVTPVVVVGDEVVPQQSN